MGFKPFELVAPLCFVGLAFGSTPTNAQNSLVDIGPGKAYGINNAGQVVLQNGVYANGTLTAFPTGFTGDAINSSGAVAGLITDSLGGTSPAFYSNGTVTNIGLLLSGQGSPGLEFGSALGINDSGEVVGWNLSFQDTVFAFIYSNGTATGLPNPPSCGNMCIGTQAIAVNNSGLVIGVANSQAQQGSHDAFIFDSVAATWTDFGLGSDVSAINANGQVVGTATTPFIYANGITTAIPIAGIAINTTGQVVGGNYFYSGGIVDLNNLVSAADPLKPYVSLTSAAGINDSLLIAVNGVDSRSQLPHAYIVQAPWITISPGPLQYPSQAIGAVGSSQIETITNTGSIPLPLDSVSASVGFSQTNDCGASLPPGAACVAMVTFSPTQSGDLTGDLTITTGSVPVLVPLAGTASINIAISSNATSVTAGKPVTLTWTASPGATCTATGGSDADGWSGAVAASGSKAVTETTAGTYPYGLSCVAGSQSQSAQASVVVTWPPVSVSLSALPASFTAGQSVTLTWNSVNATSCAATGGGAGDSWPGTKAISGSAVLTEPYAPATPSLTLTFTLTCKSSASGLSANASAKSIENAAPAPAPAGKSGGGTLDPLWLLYLAGVAALRRLRR